VATRTNESPVVVSLDGWLGTNDVAEIFDVPPRVVLRMIREERLKAVKVSWVWMIHQSWLPDSWPPPKR
jgi:hypothetical protein